MTDFLKSGNVTLTFDLNLKTWILHPPPPHTHTWILHLDDLTNSGTCLVKIPLGSSDTPHVYTEVTAAENDVNLRTIAIAHRFIKLILVNVFHVLLSQDIIYNSCM